MSLYVTLVRSTEVRVLATVRVPSAKHAGAELRGAVGDGPLPPIEVGPLSLDVIDDLLLESRLAATKA